MYAKFKDRSTAGKLLCPHLKKQEIVDGIILALPRGGVSIGFELASCLQLPLDVFLAKKIGYPGNPEFAIGSVTLTGTNLNGPAAEVDPAYLAREVARIRQQLQDRYAQYYGTRAPLPLTGKTVILVDDGAATGNTLFGAIEALRQEGQVKKIIVAIPVAAAAVAKKLKKMTAGLVCLLTPVHLMAIGSFYEDFSPVEDQVVSALLEQAAAAND
ncbi:MAG: phosphoribosyltransferase [Bacteroidetes bacterium]|nr:MAG: phosphoribosyltransferase [Bacteroidota bacterium]PTM12107.1 MAG: phosphoribosyltransferase [Bacteroidota bacterium]